MTTYVDAYHQARQYLAAGVTRAELQALSRRYDSDGEHATATAFNAVANE
ncbi:hypothetical protein ACQP2T_63615 (plasmid) [Nonomuraea sp. CA-143628]